jgi:hypothetical protein
MIHILSDNKFHLDLRRLLFPSRHGSGQLLRTKSGKWRGKGADARAGRARLGEAARAAAGVGLKIQGQLPR